MHLQSSNADLFQPAHFRPGIGNVFRMYGPKRQQPFRIDRTILGDPIVYFRREANYVRADVINKPGAFDFHVVHEPQKFLRTLGIRRDFVVVAAPAPNQIERGGMDHLMRSDMNVDVNDGRQTWVLRQKAMKRTQMLYRWANPFSSKPTTTRPPATTTGRRIRFGSRAIIRIASPRDGGLSFIWLRR